MPHARIRHRFAAAVTATVLAGLIAAATLIPAAVAAAAGVPAPEVRVSRSLIPAVKALPPLRPGGRQRAVARLKATGHAPADFVADELIVSARSRAALRRVAARWHGRIVKTVRPRTAGLDVDPVSLLRIHPPTAAHGLGRKLQKLDGRATGLLRVSSRRGRGVLAAATSEAVRGTRVGVNWLSAPQTFENRTTLEALNGPATEYPQNSFLWSYMRAEFPSLGAAEAWRTLSLANKLGNKVDVAILDGGFQPNADFPGGTTALSVFPGIDPIGTPNPLQPDKAWHGTNVAEVAAAVPGNNYGVAGPAGPVARLHLVYTTGDMFMGIAAVTAAVADGAEILNMSYSVAVPATLSFSVYPFEDVTEGAYATGHLLFASAGNDGDDVDAEDCPLGFCWEEEWYAPCENNGVICVGGLFDASDWRHPDSNWGEEWCESKFCDVDIFGPYGVVIGPDPAAPANKARSAVGTSYSSPYVAGVAALIWAANPGLSAKQVKDILYSTAAGSPDPTVNRVVNAAAAVKAALGGPNVKPKVTITAPASGATVAYGGFNFVDFKASAIDVEPGCCTITWSSDKDGFLGAGASIQEVLGTPGTHTITAKAKDAGGATSTASITLTATNKPPQPKITQPVGPVSVRNIPYTFAGEATDPNQVGKLPCSSLTWKSSVAGDSTFPATGCQIVAVFTTKGPRTITLTAKDEHGKTATTTKSIVIVFDPPTHSPPIVSISNPHDGASLDPGKTVVLAATAVDPDGSTNMSYEWSVTVGAATKVIGTTKLLLWAPGDDVPPKCGGRAATLTFKATDEDGTGADSAPITVIYPPC
jgi:hypothetical protein